MPDFPRSNDALARLLLILGLAFVFVWFGVDKIIRPLYWIGWIPSSFEGVFGLSRNSWLNVFGVVEIVIGFGILFPSLRLHLFHPTGLTSRRSLFLSRFFVAIAILHLLAVISQTGLSDVGIRDIGLLAMALGLWVLLPSNYSS